MAYVVIIDDDEDFAMAAAEILRDDGHEVGIVARIGDAIASMEERRPDLVVLDVMFPQGSSAGFDLARTMRHENEAFKDIPILMLTAVDQKFPFGFSSCDIDDASLPVDDFLEKPMEADVLQRKVGLLLGRARSGETEEPEQPPQP